LTGDAFFSGIIFIKKTFIEMNHLFIQDNVKSNEAMPIVTGEGILQKGVPYIIEFLLTWLSFGLIILGFIYVLRNNFFPPSKKIPDYPLKINVESLYLVISLFCGMALMAIVLIPFLSKGYSMNRLYGIVLIILSFYFVVGCHFLAGFFHISPIKFILLLLVPFFLLTSGFMYSLLGFPNSIVLNSKGNEYTLYLHDQDSYGAKWLGSYGNKSSRISTDFVGGIILTSQGGIQLDSIDRNFEFKSSETGSYVYLRSYNTLEGNVDIHNNVGPYKTLEYNDKLVLRNKIYSNYESEVWT
jgi:uncharacterized membrane protein